MSTELLTILMFAGIFVGVFTGFPIAFVLGSLGIIFGLIALEPHQLLYMVPLRLFKTYSTEVFAAIPLFIFMGALVERSGIADRAYEVTHKMMGPVRGGLAVATVVVCTFFAAATGVVGASVVTMGLIAIPSMVSRGYDKSLATGTVAAGGTLGQLIPPSIMLILYAPMAGVSVVDMFAGAILPGLILSALFISYILIRCYINPNVGPALTVEERGKIVLRSLLLEIVKSVLPFAFLIMAVLGSIFLGFAAPTEAAAMGAFGSLILAAIYRKLTWQALQGAAYISLKSTAMVMFIVLGAFLFTGTFLSAGCGKAVSSFLLGFGLGPWGVLLILLVLIFFLGMFIDWIGILYIMVPIFGPMMIALGFEPLWLGLIICISLQMSFITPPFAYTIFYLKGLSLEGIRLGDIYRGVIPFVFLQAIGLALCLIFKPLTLWLPSLLAKQF